MKRFRDGGVLVEVGASAVCDIAAALALEGGFAVGSYGQRVED